MRRIRSAAAVAIASCVGVTSAQAQEPPYVERLGSNPIISPDMLLGGAGENINGPSLIRVPDWLPNPLGRYYLYFAHHEGEYIRLAYSNSLSGPWTIHEPGTLRLDQTRCDAIPNPDMVSYKHVASPDVLVMEGAREIRMYFHCNVFLGGDPDSRNRYPQRTLLATSRDGIRFEAGDEVLGRPYFRAFEWEGHYYALGMPGVVHRSRDGVSGFEQGPTLFSPQMRHSAVRVLDDHLQVFYTVVGDDPEKILLSEIELTEDWMEWRATDPVVVLEPTEAWEGGNLEGAPSSRGAMLEPARQLRDPALFEEEGQTYLLYSVAGEQGIGIARLIWPEP